MITKEQLKKLQNKVEAERVARESIINPEVYRKLADFFDAAITRAITEFGSDWTRLTIYNSSKGEWDPSSYNWRSIKRFTDFGTEWEKDENTRNAIIKAYEKEGYKVTYSYGSGSPYIQINFPK